MALDAERGVLGVYGCYCFKCAGHWTEGHRQLLTKSNADECAGAARRAPRAGDVRGAACAAAGASFGV